MIVFLGFVIVVLVVVVMGLLLQLKCVHDDKMREVEKVNRHLIYLQVRHERNSQKLNDYDKTAKEVAKLSLNIDKLTEKLRIANEERDYYQDEAKAAVEQIKKLECDILHKERMIEAHAQTAELAQKEIKDLGKALREYPSRENAKALMLQYLQEIQNLKLLNDLLENANSGYAAQIGEMERKIKELEFGNIRLPADAHVMDEYELALSREECANDQEVG